MISKSRDNLTALSCIRRLRVELLESEKRDLDLIEVLDGPDGFERRLYDRRNILAEAEGKPKGVIVVIYDAPRLGNAGQNGFSAILYWTTARFISRSESRKHHFDVSEW